LLNIFKKKKLRQLAIKYPLEELKKGFFTGYAIAKIKASLGIWER